MKIIQATHTADLAKSFGAKVKDLIDTDESYKEIFPDIGLKKDEKASGKWKTSSRGEYYAVGVGGALAGRGADLCVIDDPHALEVNTPILTTDGWKTIGTVMIGDFVYGSDGKPTEVVAKSHVYHDRELYRASCSDGSEIFCDAKHLWTVRQDTNRNATRHTRTAESLVGYSLSTGPYLDAVELQIDDDIDLSIDPYTLGCWLGDGTSSLGRITSEQKDQPIMRSRIESAGYETTDLADEFSFGILKLRKQLIDCNLLNNKHIPIKYFYASRSQRLALLNGLMDTDGNVTESGQCAYHGKDPVLVDGVRRLLNTFGIYPTMCSYFVNGAHGDCLMYRVTFKMKDAAFLPRKRERTCEPARRAVRKLSIEQTGKFGSVQCITVANEDGLFLAGLDLILTHNSEQDVITHNDKAVFQSAYDWYLTGPRQRLQPGAALVLVQTRWSKMDLCGRILDKAREDGELHEWEVIELPAILESGNPLWPGYWSLRELDKLKKELPVSRWSAQYMQQPVSQASSIIKRDWWKPWPHDHPPKCEYVIQSWDTAFTAKEAADPSACVELGVFYMDAPNGNKQANIIVLDAFQKRMEFPELKEEAWARYKLKEPDTVLIEGRSSGVPLIQELRMRGLPIQEFSGSVRGNDKTARVNSISDLFSSGVVWYPEGKKFADEIITQFEDFPVGVHDDLVDATTQALIRFRMGGFLPLDTDYEDEEDYEPVIANYY